MQIASDTIEERQLFTFEERTAVLKKTYGMCACCGKKLTTKTMTVDHMIPLSRGGTNNMENLVALCEKHNKEKGNLLLVPNSYYTALVNTPLIRQLEALFLEWFHTVKEQFDIIRFPLIAPRVRIQMTFSERTSRKVEKCNPQLLLEWTIINRDTYDEIEAVTGLRLKEIRTHLAALYPFPNEEEQEGYPVPIVALYALRKISSQKIIAVAAIRIHKKRKHLDVMLPWTDCSRLREPILLYHLTILLFHSVSKIAGYEMTGFSVSSPSQRALQIFFNNANAIRSIVPETIDTDTAVYEEWDIPDAVYFPKTLHSIHFGTNYRTKDHTTKKTTKTEPVTPGGG